MQDDFLAVQLLTVYLYQIFIIPVSGDDIDGIKGIAIKQVDHKKTQHFTRRHVLDIPAIVNVLSIHYQ